MFSSIAPHTSPIEQGHSLNSNALNSNLLKSSAFGNKSAIADLFNSNVQRQQSDSFAIFSAVLKEVYQKIAFSPESSNVSQTTKPPEIAEYDLADYNQGGKISSKQAVQNILGFISQRLRSDAADGADPEQLLQRLDQGLEGFIKGFDEAKNIIEGLGLLTPELSAEINATFEGVTQGIGSLRDRINAHSQPDIQPHEPLDGIGDINRSDNLSRLELAGQVSESSSFSLSLTTRDGDQVSIEISKFKESSFNRSNFSSSFSQNGINSNAEIGQQSTSSSSFSLNVIGELDDGELAAINDLLQNVDAIANDFYSGRLDQAFELASELKIDRDELSSLNLQLQKITTTHALASYQSNSTNVLSPLNSAEGGISAGTESGAGQLLPSNQLEQLLNELQGLLTKADEFDHPLKLVNDLSSGVEQTYQPQAADKSLADSLNSLISQFNL